MGKLNEEMKHIKKGELTTLREDLKEYKWQIQVLKEMHWSQEIEARTKNNDNKYLKKKVAKLEKIMSLRGAINYEKSTIASWVDRTFDVPDRHDEIPVIEETEEHESQGYNGRYDSGVDAVEWMREVT